ncbi:MAG: hypothetical protein JWP82_2906 [Humibacillus sp.]|nr:hypothetical protein [Humibacillus sp.]
MSPALQVGPDVTVASSPDGTTLYAARLPSGPIVVLEGAGAVIWREATLGEPDGWVDRVAESFDVGRSDIEGDVAAFVDDLVRQGLLTHAPAR